MVGLSDSDHRQLAGRIAIYYLKESSLVNTFLKDLANPANLLRIVGMYPSGHEKKNFLQTRLHN
jgi:hypothetical protein